MRWPALTLLLALLAGSLGFVRLVRRADRFPLRDVVVPVTGKQYRVADASEFTVFVAYGDGRDAWRREAAGLAPYVAERAARRGDTLATVLALKPGFARLFPPTEAGWYRFGVRDGTWQLVGEARTRSGLGRAR